MKKFIRIFLGLLGCGLLALALMPSTERQALASNPSNPAPVYVTNTPLPVQGSVSVGNTPNVNIANSAVPVSGNVAVANSVDSGNQPIPLVVSAQGTPYADSCTATVGNGNPDNCSMKPLDSGKRLVIQSITFSSYVYNGVYRSAELDSTVGGNYAPSFFAPSQIGTQPYFGGSYTYQAANDATVLYADPGTSPTCGGVPTVSNDRGFTCTISGYLLPAR